MNILILGGTKFIGKYFVELCNNHGQTITIANRGLSKHNLPDNIQFIKINRQSIKLCKNLSNNIEYDCVVDFSCYNINDFNSTISYIKCKKYLLISSTGVNDINRINESHSLYRYCIDKKNLEEYIFNNSFIFPIIIIRPCIVYGHNDYTNRFEFRDNDFYWIGSTKKAKDSENCTSVEYLGSALFDIMKLDTYSSYIIQITRNIQYV